MSIENLSHFPLFPLHPLSVEDMRACCRYTRRRPDRTHGGVLNVHTGSFFSSLLFASLFFSRFSLLSFSFLFLLLFFCSCSCSFSFSFSFPFPSTHSSLLFPSRQHTVQSTDQHVNVIWRTAGAQQSVLSPPLHSLLPSLPLLLLKKRELFITGMFPATNVFLLQFSINSKKSPPGENYRRYSF